MQYRIDPEFESKLRKLSAEEYGDLADKIHSEGCKADALTVGDINGDYILIDGHNTRQICEESGIELPKPRLIKFKSREDAFEWVKKNQRSRRNLSAEEMQELRQERIERVAEARAEGKSLRTIAKDEGVSEKQVRLDLEKAGAEDYAPGKVKGEDGKEYPSKPDIRCARCKRTGQDGSKCQACFSLRNPRRVSDAKPSQKAEPSPNGTGTAESPKPIGGLCPYCGRVWKGSTFIKPTVEQVAAYVKDIKAEHCEPEEFIDHFDSNGWKVGGKGRMTDWKAAVRNWNRRGAKNTKPKGGRLIDEIRARNRAEK